MSAGGTAFQAGRTASAKAQRSVCDCVKKNKEAGGTSKGRG